MSTTPKAGDVLVRLSVELPPGVVVKTRSTLPRLEAFGGLLHTFLRNEHSSEYRGTTPTVLELEFPAEMRSSVEDALRRLVQVGRL